MNHYQAFEIAAKSARAYMRKAGLDVKAVAYFRQHEDGEFASVDKWYADRLAQVLEANSNVIERGRETGSKVFVNFTPQFLATLPHA